MTPVAHSPLKIQLTVALFTFAVAIGLIFMRRPSRAWAFWILGLLQAGTGIACSLVGEEARNEPIRRVGVALTLYAIGYAWSALRARRGTRSFGWLAPVLTAAAIAALVPTPVPVFAIVFAVGFSGSGAIAVAIVVELLRGADARQPLALPFVLMNALVAVSAAASLLSLLVLRPEGQNDLALLRWINTIGGTLYLLSQLVFMIHATRAGQPTHAAQGDPHALIDDRRARARERGEPVGAVLYVRLDAADSIAAATGSTVYDWVIEAFESGVRAAVPSGADVFFGPPGAAIVQLSAPTTAVRAAVRDLLTRVSGSAPTGLLPVTLSASVGWVPPEIDESAAATIERARAACDRAESAGGDRWERVEAAAPGDAPQGAAATGAAATGDAAPEASPGHA